MDLLKTIRDGAKEIGEVAKDLTKKSGDLVEVTKLKYEINKMEKIIETNLAAIGELYFRTTKGEVGLEDELTRLCASTVKLESDIKDYQEQVEKLSPKPALCAKCQAELPEGALYCPMCGEKVNK